ncbi:MAG: carboxyl transferase [Proteobacteria bacterium]|nr:carboxyl transferase [Pseudomonadota bacterium]
MSTTDSAEVSAEWSAILKELDDRTRAAQGMGGPERIARQRERGRLNARERVEKLCDPGTFFELGTLAGGAHPGGHAPVPTDALVGGTGRIDGHPVVIAAEDFTVLGGSIGHANAAKRLRLASLALQERRPLVLMLDGAGERATNTLERYPFAPNDLQVVADLVGRIPVVTLVLGTSAGHGALTGMFADLIIAAEGACLFTAGPPLVRAATGQTVSAEELGGARIHAEESGVVHNLAATEDEAIEMARRFLSYLSGETPNGTARASARRELEDLTAVVPANPSRPYDMRDVLERLVDAGSLFELQPRFGAAIVTCFARIGGRAALIVANQPQVMAGAITREAAEKATHFLRVARSFELPVVFLADNPGVLSGPEAERAGTLRAAAQMYSAQRALRGPKIHVTLRKAFGFGSSLMGMNPFDGQTLTLAFPAISLGGVPAQGGADAAHASRADREKLQELQAGAWRPADNGSFDRVIDPRQLRNELIRALEDSRQGLP